MSFQKRLFAGKSRFCRRTLAILLCSAVFLSGLPASAQSGQAENPNTPAEEETEPEGEALAPEGSYAYYLKTYEGVPFSDAEFTLDGAGFTDTDQEIEVFQNYEGAVKPAILTPEEGYVEWNFNVPETGMYRITMEYLGYGGKGSDIERILQIDGRVPYDEANYLIFPRTWKDVYGTERKDINGNDIRPGQEEIKKWLKADFRDSSGYYPEPFAFYLEKGRHTLRLTSVREPLMIESFTFHGEEAVKSYDEVKSEYDKAGYKPADGAITYIQAEDNSEKSEKSNYPLNDRSSSFTQPQEVDHIILNTIGGTKWQKAGSTVTWKAAVTKSGLYKIVPRFRQNVYSGVYVSRKLLINGKAPFKEAESLRFNYSEDWQCKALGNGSEDYLFYFEAGKEYEISFEAVLGNMGDILRRTQDCVVSLNEIYRKILMITGANPDKYRDYEFEKLIPDTLKAMKVQAEELDSLTEKITQLTGVKGERAVQLDKMAYLVGRMVEKPDEIPGKFNYFKDNIAALGTWILDTAKQPLELDYIALVPENQDNPKANEGFFGGLAFSVKIFLASFHMDYETAGTTKASQGGSGSSIKVWLATGRDQQSIIRSLIDSSFTPDTGITVDLQLVNPGTLLPSILAGNGPDVSLSNAVGDPINFAVRGAAEDISPFDGFDEVVKRFHESAMVPYEFNGAAYALPETQSFNMMFYRTDIFGELNLKAPKTWKDFDILIPELQKKNMSIGLPHDLNTLLTFMYQNGTGLYNNDGETTNLDSQNAVLAFIKMMDYYTLYDFPTEYDFVNRFRSGEMPLAIADYTLYNQLSLFAPEIKGSWEMTLVPGTLEENGSINQVIPSTGTSVMMMKNAENKEASWEFMKWWTSADVQSSFGMEMESVINAAAKQPTANIEALKRMPWSVKDLNSILDQWEYVEGTPEVPGGYYTARVQTFAFNKVYNDKDDAADTLQSYIEPLNAELHRKRVEFGLE